MNYARETSVSAEQSRMEIERILTRYGAAGFMYATELNRAVLGFKIKGRIVRLAVPLPVLSEFRFSTGNRERTARQQQTACDQAIRARWRAVKLIIQAKLEAVADGISTYEREFMPDIVMPDNRTLGDHLTPAIEEAYKTGRVPELMPWGARQLTGGPVQ
jgi:hypothetical protein